MGDGADPILEAVAALRAAGVAVAQIGDELDRWQIGDSGSTPTTLLSLTIWALAYPILCQQPD